MRKLRAAADPVHTERLRGLLGRIDPAIAGLTILGLALASYRLGTKSLWLDEAVSADHARLGLGDLLTVISGRDPNMGLYYLLLHFWVRGFGYGAAAVRGMTVILASLAVPVVAGLGQRMFGRVAGLVAGLLLALAPFFVRYEQTARSYALVVLLCALSSYCFVAELEKPSRATLVGYVVASTLAVYTHYFAVFVLLAQFLTLLAVERRAALTAHWVAAGAAVVVLCVPEAVFSLRAGTGNISWIHSPTFGGLLALPSDLAGGRALAGGLIVLAGYGFASAVNDRRRWPAGFAAAWLLAPVLIVFAVSKLGPPLFVDYYLIIVLPAFLLLAASGVARLTSVAVGGLPRGSVAAIALGLIVVLSLLGVHRWHGHPSLEDYRSATRYILANEHPDDRIVYYPAGSRQGPASGFTYYEALDGAHGPTPVPFRLGRAPRAGGSRIWLVIRQSDVPARRQSQVQATMAGRYVRAGHPTDFRNLAVSLYRPRSRAG